MKKEKDQGEKQLIATKVTAYTRGRLFAMADRLGVSLYYFLQTILDGLIKCIDEPHDVTPDFLALVTASNVLRPNLGALTLPDFGTGREISRAVCFVSAPGRSPYLVEIEGKGDGFRITTNTDQIARDVLGTIDARIVDDLGKIKGDAGAFSSLDALRFAVLIAQGKPKTFEERLHDDVAELFSDNERHEFGRKAHEYENAPIRHRTPKLSQSKKYN